MKILLIGGSGFIGAFAIRQLQQAGHQVTVFHRGKVPVPEGISQILGDRNHLSDYRAQFAQERFDVVIDFVLSSVRQARQLMEAHRGVTPRVIALSSMDVYRAWGVFYGLEPGGLEPLPLNEDSALRTQPAYPPEVVKKLQQMVTWVDGEYDKVPAERVVLTDPHLRGTVLRLPMVYGPGDYVHRFYPVLKRIDDGRKHIIFADDVAALRTPRGYVEDVAAAIVLAATSPQSTGRVYNVGETEFFGELDWARKIAAATGWYGEFVVLPHDKTPKHLHWPGNTAQHLVVFTDRIRKELGYRELLPRAEAIRRTIAWERAHPPAQPMTVFDYAAEDQALAELKASGITVR
ncbi:MAG TPA: NAD-dependent epimerase/dehydratase family protein [Candidatus Angelobacter sp.]|jgi:nucleoside-diphosphate-sugar epimerase